MILDPRVVGNEYKKIAKIFLAVRPKTAVRRKQRRREKTAKMTTAKHFALHANPCNCNKYVFSKTNNILHIIQKTSYNSNCLGTR